MDDNGHEHLAVVGEERDPRDGHYNYYAEKPFSLIRPLACQNRTKVHEYLEAVRHTLNKPVVGFGAERVSTPHQMRLRGRCRGAFMATHL